MTADHDIDAWLKSGAPLDTAPYRLESPRTFAFHLTREGASELEAALKVWTSSAMGLSKLVTRIKVTAQMLHCEPAGAEVAAQARPV